MTAPDGVAGDVTAGSSVACTDEESRAAMRAFLQRSEVRLSTIHRVAQGLLGGSALVLLLPLFLRDAFPKMMTVLLALYDAGQGRVPIVALGIAVALVILLPVPAIFLLVGDLLAFYFTSNTFGSHRTGRDDRGDGVDAHDGGPTAPDPVVFSPRFVIPGLGFNRDELNERTQAMLDVEREDEWTRGLLVPPGAADGGWRDRFDARVHDIWGVLPAAGPEGDAERVRQSYRMAGLHRDRTLAQDVARTEALLARHVLGIRTALLRYSKALLLIVSTTVITLAASGLVDQAVREDPDGGRFVNGFPYRIVFLVGLAYVIWAPLAARSVTAPLRMIHRHTPGVGEHRDVYRDRQTTQFESATIVVTAVVLVCASIAVLTAGWSAAGGIGLGLGVGVVAVGLAAWLAALSDFRATPRHAVAAVGLLLGGPTNPAPTAPRRARRGSRA